MKHKGLVIVVILFIVITRNFLKDKKLNNEAGLQQPSFSSTAVSLTTSAATSNSSGSQHANIEQTLRVVSQKHKSTDVNRDGLYNCIDAAVLFYQHYPDRNSVAIIVNKNPNTDMHHLFNAVLINGVWRAIEPQAYTCPNWERLQTYFMQDIWGNQYNRSFNRDETEKWEVYIN